MRNCYLKTDKERKLIASQVVPFEKEPEYLYFEYYGRLEDLDLENELIITDELLETLNNEIPETPDIDYGQGLDDLVYRPITQQDYTKYYLEQEKATIERRLETISNLYTAKVHIFKEWEETDQRVIDLLNEREQLRLRHDELKLLIENETHTD